MEFFQSNSKTAKSVTFMAPRKAEDDAGRVPFPPKWTCPDCGAEGNYGTRVICRSCSHTAPKKITEVYTKYIAAGGEPFRGRESSGRQGEGNGKGRSRSQPRPKTAAQRSATPAKYDKDLLKRLDQMQEQLAKISSTDAKERSPNTPSTGSGSGASASTNLSAGSNANTGVSATEDEDARKIAVLDDKIKGVEQLRQSWGASDNVAKDDPHYNSLGQQLEEFRRERDALKAKAQSPLARQNYLQRRLQQAAKKRDSAKTKKEEVSKQITLLQQQLVSVQKEEKEWTVEHERLGTELAAAAEAVRAGAAGPAAAAVPDRGLPPEIAGLTDEQLNDPELAGAMLAYRKALETVATKAKIQGLAPAATVAKPAAQSPEPDAVLQTVESLVEKTVAGLYTTGGKPAVLGPSERQQLRTTVAASLGVAVPSGAANSTANSALPTMQVDSTGGGTPAGGGTGG